MAAQANWNSSQSQAHTGVVWGVFKILLSESQAQRLWFKKSGDQPINLDFIKLPGWFWKGNTIWEPPRVYFSLLTGERTKAQGPANVEFPSLGACLAELPSLCPQACSFCEYIKTPPGKESRIQAGSETCALLFMYQLAFLVLRILLKHFGSKSSTVRNREGSRRKSVNLNCQYPPPLLNPPVKLLSRRLGSKLKTKFVETSISGHRCQATN